MSKRELNEFERKISTKSLVRLKNELEGIEKLDIAQKQLAIDTADISAKRQVGVLTREVKALTREAEIIKETLSILEDQLENGVEELKEVKEIEPPAKMPEQNFEQDTQEEAR